MGRVEYHALLLILLFLNASMVGCFANDDGSEILDGDALNIAPDPLTAGIFQSVYFKADEAMRVLIPYLVLQYLFMKEILLLLNGIQVYLFHQVMVIHHKIYLEIYKIFSNGIKMK